MSTTSPDPEGGSPGGTCRSCAGRLAAGQRYCLDCGDRVGSHRVAVGPVLTAIAAASVASAGSTDSPPIAVETGPESVVDGASESVAASLATKPAASAGLALLVVGAVAGAAFSPPAATTFAAQQRVVIVRAAGEPVSAPPAEEVVDPGVVDTAIPPPEPLPEPAPEPYVPPAPPAPEPPPVLTDPSIGHLAFVMLPGGAAGQTLGSTGSGASERTSHKRAVAAGDADYRSAFSRAIAAGFLLKGFRQVGSSGIANAFALMTGREPTPEMNKGCEGPIGDVHEGSGCLVPGSVEDLVTLATQQLASKSQAIRVYVETPNREDGDYRGLCSAPRPGDRPQAADDGTPSHLEIPVLWFRALTGEPGSESFLCHTASSDGAIRPLSMLEDDLRRAAAEDSENFDPTVPSAHPKITLIVPSPCRVSAESKCPDGSPGGPQALKSFLDGPVTTTLAGSDVFQKDGATIAMWDRPVAGSPAATGAVVLSPFVKAGGSNSLAYDTFGLLATAQKRFGLAGDTGLPPLLGRSDGAKPLGREVFPRR